MVRLSSDATPSKYDCKRAARHCHWGDLLHLLFFGRRWRRQPTHIPPRRRRVRPVVEVCPHNRPGCDRGTNPVACVEGLTTVGTKLSATFVSYRRQPVSRRRYRKSNHLQAGRRGTSSLQPISSPAQASAAMAAPNSAGIARGSAGLWPLCHRRSASGVRGAFRHELFKRASRLARLLSLRSALLHGPWRLEQASH